MFWSDLVWYCPTRKTHGQLPCSTPMHPCSAIAMAIFSSVTVSIAAEANGKAFGPAGKEPRSVRGGGGRRSLALMRRWGLESVPYSGVWFAGTFDIFVDARRAASAFPSRPARGCGLYLAALENPSDSVAFFRFAVYQTQADVFVFHHGYAPYDVCAMDVIGGKMLHPVSHHGYVSRDARVERDLLDSEVDAPREGDDVIEREA